MAPVDIGAKVVFHSRKPKLLTICPSEPLANLKSWPVFLHPQYICSLFYWRFVPRNNDTLYWVLSPNYSTLSLAPALCLKSYLGMTFSCKRLISLQFKNFSSRWTSCGAFMFFIGISHVRNFDVLSEKPFFITGMCYFYCVLMRNVPYNRCQEECDFSAKTIFLLRLNQLSVRQTIRTVSRLFFHFINYNYCW